MRPQDVPILLKILSYSSKGQLWQMKKLAADLGISASEVSESLNRSVQSDLINRSKREVSRLALLDFLSHGIRYVFPQKPGAIVRGLKTAHSAPPLANLIASEEHYVWADAYGESRGQAIEPLYPSLVEASKKDDYLYQSLALIDALRVGRVREQELAKQELKKLILKDGE
ncbi:MAG: hypothetical protein J0L67_03690 [Cytophagales bacterium]|nr:hypothetical protein [Cytophagales bacterium]